MNPGAAAYISLRIREQLIQFQSSSPSAPKLLSSLSDTSFKPKHRTFLDREMPQVPRSDEIDPMLRMFLQDQQGRKRAQRKLLKELQKQCTVAYDQRETQPQQVSKKNILNYADQLKLPRVSNSSTLLKSATSDTVSAVHEPTKPLKALPPKTKIKPPLHPSAPSSTTISSPLSSLEKCVTD